MPLQIGNRLLLKLTWTHDEGISIIESTVVDIFTSTMSATLKVSTHANTEVDAVLPDEAVLKLYDGQFIKNPREQHSDGSPWDLDKERAFQRYVADGRAAPKPLVDTITGKLEAGALEVLCAELRSTMYQAERTAYARPESLRGR